MTMVLVLGMLFACHTVLAAPPLELERTIPLPGVEGRIDHFYAGPRVVLAELGNRTVELIDPVAARVSGRLSALAEPQGVFELPEAGRIAVACAGDGAVHWYDSRTLAPAGVTTLGDDADNVRYDAAAKRLWVGYGDGAVAWLDPATGKRGGEIRVPGHPEAFQLEAGGPRIFINVPDAHLIVVANRESLNIEMQWPLQEGANFPMAVDDERQRVLVATRDPAKLLVFHMKDGRRLATIPCVADADDVWWDSAINRGYISGGGGAITVVALTAGDRYRVLGTIPTAPGARTSAFDPKTRHLYLAVPHRGAQQAELRVYRCGSVRP